MANYFVSSIGNNGNGLTWATAKTSLAGAVGLLLGGGNVIYIDGSTFNIAGNTEINKVGASDNYNQIIGSAGSIDDGTGNFGQVGETIYNLSGYNGTGFSTTGDGTNIYLKITYVNFKESAASTNKCFDTFPRTGLIIAHCKFTDVAIAIYDRLNAGGEFYNNIFEGSKFYGIAGNPMITLALGKCYNNIFKSSLAYPLRNAISTTSATPSFYNNIVIGGTSIQVNRTGGAGNMILKNNIVIGGRTTPVSITSGLVDDYNNLYLPNGASPTANEYTGSTRSYGGLQNQNPMLKSMPFIGYMFLTIDDSGNEDLVYYLANNVYGPRSQKIIWAITGFNGISDVSAAQTFLENGNDISAHSFSHPADLTSLNAIQIKSSRTNPTVTITNVQAGDSTTWTGTIVLKGDGDSDLTLTYDGVVSEADNQKRFVGGVVAWINDQVGWSAEVHADAGYFGKSVCLSDCIATAVDNVNWTVFTYDSPEYYQVEITETKTILETLIRTAAPVGSRAATYEMILFTPPANQVDDTIRDLVATAGHTAARSGTELKDDFTLGQLRQLYPYNLSLYQYTTIFNNGASLETGTHTGANNAAILTDAAATFTPSALVGKIIVNLTDGSSGVITANDATTVTVTLSNGTDNDWDTNDSYRICDQLLIARNSAALSMACEAEGMIVMPYTHGVSAIGWSIHEHDAFSSGCMNSNYANLKTVFNDWIDMVWDGTASPDGNGWTVGAGDSGSPDHTLRFDHTFVDLSNFQLRPGSPALRNGVAIVGLITDYEGNPVPMAGGYNIGPYNNQYVNSPMGLSPGLGGGGKIFPRRRRR